MKMFLKKVLTGVIVFATLVGSGQIFQNNVYADGSTKAKDSQLTPNNPICSFDYTMYYPINESNPGYIIDPVFKSCTYSFSNKKITVKDEGTPLLMINGTFVQDKTVIIKNGRSLVPIRVISDVLGYKVSWDGKKQLVTVENSGTSIELTINKSTATVNEKELKLDASPIIVDGSTYVPLRFISETLGMDVGYCSHSKPEGCLTINPIVWVDKGISADSNKEKTTVLDKLKSVLLDDSKDYTTNEGYTDNDKSYFNDLSGFINSLKYDGQNGPYAIYSGFRFTRFFVNLKTGEMFSELTSIDGTSFDEGDYSTFNYSIEKLGSGHDGYNQKIFAYEFTN